MISEERKEGKTSSRKRKRRRRRQRRKTSVDEVGLDLWLRYTSELLSAVHIFI